MTSADGNCQSRNISQLLDSRVGVCILGMITKQSLKIFLARAEIADISSEMLRLLSDRIKVDVQINYTVKYITFCSL